MAKKEKERREKAEASFWFTLKILKEAQGDYGLTEREIWDKLKSAVENQELDPSVAYLVGLNGTFHSSLIRAVNSGTLEQKSGPTGFPDRTRFIVTDRGKKLLKMKETLIQEHIPVEITPM